MTKYMMLFCFAAMLPALAHAEYRTIAVEINRAKDKSIKGTIHSDVKSEKKTDISVADATEIMKKAKARNGIQQSAGGYGSQARRSSALT